MKFFCNKDDRFDLDNNVDINSKTNDDWTALMTACYNNHLKIVKLLFSSHCNYVSTRKKCPKKGEAICKV